MNPHMPTRHRTALAVLYWAWIVAMLGCYIASFGAILRLLFGALLG